jgi:multidrug efflux pump subunit AcrA (membrane-fusion protein)
LLASRSGSWGNSPDGRRRRSGQAESTPATPPEVGIVEAVKRPITESSEFLGRIEAINRVNLVARVMHY